MEKVLNKVVKWLLMKFISLVSSTFILLIIGRNKVTLQALNRQEIINLWHF